MNKSFRFHSFKTATRIFRPTVLLCLCFAIGLAGIQTHASKSVDDLDTSFRVSKKAKIKGNTSDHTSDKISDNTSDKTSDNTKRITKLKTHKFSNLEWKLDLGGRLYQSEREGAQLTYLSVPVRFDYLLLSTLSLKADLSLILGTGRSQSLYGDVVPVNSFGITEAVINWKPVSPLSIQAGAIDTAYLDTRTLSASWAFPGVGEQIFFKGDWLSLDIRAQQTVPTSTTLNTQTVQKEETPSYITESAEIGLNFGSTEVSVFAKHFLYKNLPSFVADRSAFGGNTINQQGVNNSKFQFGFDGTIIGARGRIQFGKNFDIYGGNYIATNNKASDSYNRGQTVWVGLSTLLGRVRINPEGQIFFMESDVAPSFYTSSAYGRNNRQGFGTSLKFEFVKAAFAMTTSYVKADVINKDNLLQGDQEIFTLRFETFYDKIF